MGRWVSPDWSAKADPVPYSKLDDPQTLNLYAYVGNNPLANADPDGHACSVLLQNTGGGFCQRSDEYLKMDAQVNDKTRFFAATSAVSQALAGADAIGRIRILETHGRVLGNGRFRSRKDEPTANR
jgi:hypothetical protein